MASLTLSLHLLDTLRHTGTPLGHNLRILLGALVLLVTVKEVRRGRGEELHAAPGRGVVALALLLLADHARSPPSRRSRSPPRHLTAAPA